MKKSIDNIVINDETCTIYPSTVRRVAELFGWLVQGLFVLSAQIWIIPNRLPVAIYIIVYILTIVLIGKDVKNILFPPKPIILTREGITTPDGEFVEWGSIASIYLKPGWRTAPIFRIQTTNHWYLEIIDWYMYTNKKTLVSLFEEYSGKQLYFSVRNNATQTHGGNNVPKTPFIQKPPYRKPGVRNWDTYFVRKEKETR